MTDDHRAALALDARLDTIKAAMGLPKTDPDSYWNSPAMRAEYIRLQEEKIANEEHK